MIVLVLLLCNLFKVLYIRSDSMCIFVQVAHQKILELQNQRLVIMNLIKNAKATILDNNSEEDISEDEVPVIFL